MDTKRASEQDIALTKWAEDIAELSCQLHKVPNGITFKWRLAWAYAQYRWDEKKRRMVHINPDARRRDSSGNYNPRGNRISIKLGHDRDDAMYVVLHEIAHHIDWRQRGNVSNTWLSKNKIDAVTSWHDERFWRICFELCELNKLDMEHVYARAKNYKLRAATAAMPPEARD